MTAQLVIDVPCLPPTELMPNRKACWQSRHKASAAYGQIVRQCAIHARNSWSAPGPAGLVGWMPLERCTVQLEITIPHKRRSRYWNVYGQVTPDEKNIEAALKSAIDNLTARDRGNGAVGACIFEDDRPDCVTWLPTSITRGGEEQVRIIVTDDLRSNRR